MLICDQTGFIINYFIIDIAIKRISTFQAKKMYPKLHESMTFEEFVRNI